MNICSPWPIQPTFFEGEIQTSCLSEHKGGWLSSIGYMFFVSDSGLLSASVSVNSMPSELWSIGKEWLFHFGGDPFWAEPALSTVVEYWRASRQWWKSMQDWMNKHRDGVKEVEIDERDSMQRTLDLPLLWDNFMAFTVICTCVFEE